MFGHVRLRVKTNSFREQNSFVMVVPLRVHIFLATRVHFVLGGGVGGLEFRVWPYASNGGGISGLEFGVCQCASKG